MKCHAVKSELCLHCLLSSSSFPGPKFDRKCTMCENTVTECDRIQIIQISTLTTYIQNWNRNSEIPQKVAAEFTFFFFSNKKVQICQIEDRYTREIVEIVWGLIFSSLFLIMPLVIIKTLACGLPQSAMVFSYPGGVMTKLFLTCDEK